MGSHPVPGSKSKEEVVAREEEEEVVVEEGGEVKFKEQETDGAKSWLDVAAAAGGLIVMKDGVVEDLQRGGVGDQPASPGGQMGDQPAGPEGEAGNLPLVAEAAKKKTPLQYRLEQPKRMAEEKSPTPTKKCSKNHGIQTSPDLRKDK